MKRHTKGRIMHVDTRIRAYGQKVRLLFAYGHDGLKLASVRASPQVNSPPFFGFYQRSRSFCENISMVMFFYMHVRSALYMYLGT